MLSLFRQTTGLFVLALTSIGVIRFESTKDAFIVGGVVNTTSGAILGHPASQQPSVGEYLGIKYAQAPVNNLRFAKPKPYNGTGTEYEASHYSPACPANPALYPDGISGPGFPFFKNVVFGKNGIRLHDLISGVHVAHDEDCLSLNVWTKPQTGAKSKAVLLWLYGGGFHYGSTNLPVYDGQFLAAKQDVVVVTLNYRTNIFGFPGAPNTDQNLGLLDQRLAIKWVYDNIAEFGGDPQRITSAGAASVDMYSFAWYEDQPMVNGFIQQSGTILGTLPPIPRSEAQSNWFAVASSLGCENFGWTQSQVLDCMRNQTVDDTLKALVGLNGSSTADVISHATAINFAATIDNEIVFDNYSERAAAGQFIKKPLLIGDTDYEGGFALPALKASYDQTLPAAVVRAASDKAFTCPNKKRAAASLAAGIRTWRYRWFGICPELMLSTDPDSGVYHSVEISYFFGSGGLIDSDISAETVALSDYTMGAIAAFAKDPEDGLLKYGWPRYNPDEATLLQLGTSHQPLGPDPVKSSTFDSTCFLYGEEL